MLKQSCIIGCGHYLPDRVVTNNDLAEIVDTSHEWIVERTGIHCRHFAAEGEMTSDLATHAGAAALKNANIRPDDIDLIIVATVTPDKTFPSVATQVQMNLSISRGFAFDVSAACSGFLVALSTANQYILSGTASKALIIGAETFSRILDMTDRRTCVLFGDGAGAVVLSREVTNQNAGILGVHLHSDGQFNDILCASGGPSSTGTSGFIQMEGQEVYRHAVTKLTQSTIETLNIHQVNSEDINWMIPHQANIRIIDAIAKRLNISNDKVITTVSHHANTSAASIPLALSDAVSQNKIKSGDLIIHEAIGGGLIWGSALVRWL